MAKSLGTKENKQLLWGLLMEEGIFDTIPSDVSLPEVQKVFETTLYNLSNTSSPNASLIDLNRMAIESLATIIPEIKSERKSLITAEDIRNQKRYEIDTKLREMEVESRSYLERPTPPSIDFSDKGVIIKPLRSRVNNPPEIVDITSSLTDTMMLPMTLPITLNKPTANNANGTAVDVNSQPAQYDDINDSPIGEDMDKLIAERIAARERDLTEITNRIIPKDIGKQDVMIMRTPVPAPLSTPSPLPNTGVVTAPTVNKVRFSYKISTHSAEDHDFRETSLPILKTRESGVDIEPPPSVKYSAEIDDIYSRLKRKPVTNNTPTEDNSQNNNNNNNNNNETIRILQETVNDLKAQIEDLNRRQNELFERFAYHVNYAKFNST